MDIDGQISVRKILFIRSLRISPFFPLSIDLLYLLGLLCFLYLFRQKPRRYVTLLLSRCYQCKYRSDESFEVSLFIVGFLHIY